VVRSVLVKEITNLGGIIIQLPIFVPEQVAEFVISIIYGTVIVIVPVGA
jgi:hypothetical protein